MARLAVKPTRMELSKLKKRLKTAIRGHKLLKDKQDELIRRFMLLIKENHALRQHVEKALEASMKQFAFAQATLPQLFIQESFALPIHQTQVFIDEQNVMSVIVPKMHVQEPVEQQNRSLQYGLLNTNAQMDSAIETLQDVSKDLLKLAEVEKTCQLLADDIEKTRRRVNALEHLIVPQLEETIDYIQMKLEEQERSNLTRIMKVKDFQ